VTVTTGVDSRTVPDAPPTYNVTTTTVSSSTLTAN